MVKNGVKKQKNNTAIHQNVRKILYCVSKYCLTITFKAFLVRTRFIFCSEIQISHRASSRNKWEWGLGGAKASAERKTKTVLSRFWSSCFEVITNHIIVFSFDSSIQQNFRNFPFFLLIYQKKFHTHAAHHHADHKAELYNLKDVQRPC